MVFLTVVLSGRYCQLELVHAMRKLVHTDPIHTTPDKFANGGFTLKTHQMFSVHTTPEEFENGGFTLKTHQMFSVHSMLDEFKNATIIVILELCLR